MEQQLLCLVYYYHLVLFLLFLSYIQKIYLFLFFSFIFMIIFNRRIIYFISITIPQTSWCHRTIVTIFEQIIHWHNSIKNSAKSTNMLLNFQIHDLNGELFLKNSFFFLVLSSLSPSTIIVPLYMHNYNHTHLNLTLKF